MFYYYCNKYKNSILPHFPHLSFISDLQDCIHVSASAKQVAIINAVHDSFDMKSFILKSHENVAVHLQFLPVLCCCCSFFLKITTTLHIWVNYTNDLNPLWIPNTVFFKTTWHHATFWGAPGSVIPMIMPGFLHWMTLIIDLLHSPNIDLHSDDNSLMFRQMKRVSAGLVKISAEVDATSQHSILRLLKAPTQDLLCSISRGPVIHLVYLTTHRLRVAFETRHTGI